MKLQTVYRHLGVLRAIACAMLLGCTAVVAHASLPALDALNIGRYHAKLGDWDNAVRALTDALQMNPKLGAAYLERGRVYIQSERYALALDDLQAAVKLMPRHHDAYLARGQALHGLARYDEAISDFTYAAKLDPRSVAPIMYRGRAQLAAGRPDQAILDHQTALAVDPFADRRFQQIATALGNAHDLLRPESLPVARSNPAPALPGAPTNGPFAPQPRAEEITSRRVPQPTFTPASAPTAATNEPLSEPAVNDSSATTATPEHVESRPLAIPESSNSRIETTIQNSGSGPIEKIPASNSTEPAASERPAGEPTDRPGLDTPAASSLTPRPVFDLPWDAPEKAPALTLDGSSPAITSPKVEDPKREPITSPSASTTATTSVRRIQLPNRLKSSTNETTDVVEAEPGATDPSGPGETTFRDGVLIAPLALPARLSESRPEETATQPTPPASQFDAALPRLELAAPRQESTEPSLTQQAARRCLDYGRRLQVSGQLDAAAAEFKAAVALDPNFAEAHDALAELSRQRLEALPTTPRITATVEPPTNLKLAAPGALISDAPEPVTISDQPTPSAEPIKLTAPAPMSPAESFYARGQAALAAGNVRLAIAQFGVALTLQPVFPAARAARGMAYVGEGKYREAIVDLDQALEAASTDAQLRAHRAQALIQRRQWDQARDDLEVALRVDPRQALAVQLVTQYPQLAPAGLAIATAAPNAGSPAVAAPDVEPTPAKRTTRTAPSAPAAVISDDSVVPPPAPAIRLSATPDADRAARVEPVSAATATISDEALTGQPLDPLAAVTAELKAAPRNDDLLRYRAALLMLRQQAPAALDDAQAAVTAGPDEPLNYLARADIHAALGNTSAAHEDYTAALRLHPELAPAYLGRGRLSYDAGQLDRALADFSAVLEFEPLSAAAFHGRARVYHRRGNLMQAVADYSEALRLDDQHVEARAGLARARTELGGNR